VNHEIQGEESFCEQDLESVNLEKVYLPSEKTKIKRNQKR